MADADVYSVPTPEGSEDGVEDSSRMIKQVAHFGEHADISQVPVRTDFTQRTHLVLTHLVFMTRLTRLTTTYIQTHTHIAGIIDLVRTLIVTLLTSEDLCEQVSI